MAWVVQGTESILRIISHFKKKRWQPDTVAAKRKKKKKEEWGFFFSFPENKEDKENSEQAWTLLVFWVFLTLTAPNSACL